MTRRGRSVGRHVAWAVLAAGTVGWVVVEFGGAIPPGDRPFLGGVIVACTALGVTAALLLPRLWAAPANRGATEPAAVHITTDLLAVLLEQAAEAEPTEFAAGLAVTPAEEFEEPTGLSPTTPVFTHFIPPGAAGSASAVFGVDIGVPPHSVQGRFVSHPGGEPGLTKRDTLREVVFVAIPPWDPLTVSAYDRSGRRRPIVRVDASPPEEQPPGTAAVPDR